MASAPTAPLPPTPSTASTRTWFGVQGYSPFASAGNYFGIFGVSGQLKYVQPATGGVNGASFPSVWALYGEAGALSSTVNPDSWPSA